MLLFDIIIIILYNLYMKNKNIFTLINPTFWIRYKPTLFLKIENPSFNMQNELVKCFLKKNNNLKYSLLVDLIKKITYATLLYKLENELIKGNIYYSTDDDWYNPFSTLQVPVTFGNGLSVGSMGSGKSSSMRFLIDHHNLSNKLLDHIKSNKYYNNDAKMILDNL